MPIPTLPGRLLVFCACTAWLAFASCGSAGTEPNEANPEIERQFSESDEARREQRAREGQTGYLLKRFDDTLEAWAENKKLGSGEDVQAKVESIRNLLEQESVRFQGKLLELLRDEEPRPRWIAAAALGFSGDPKVMEALLVTLDDPVPRVRESAALGLGQLAVAYTPLDPLTRHLFDEEEALPVRRSVGRALVQIQKAKVPPVQVAEESPAPAGPGRQRQRGVEFGEIWSRLLAGDALRKDEILALHGLSGIALLGDPTWSPAVVPYLEHPRALLRQRAIMALAYGGRRQDATRILPFLSEQEVVPNVRLTARKALKKLTGNEVDHGYDTSAWRAEFGLLEQAPRDR